jgi:hypothetical protein
MLTQPNKNPNHHPDRGAGIEIFPLREPLGCTFCADGTTSRYPSAIGRNEGRPPEHAGNPGTTRTVRSAAVRVFESRSQECEAVPNHADNCEMGAAHPLRSEA